MLAPGCYLETEMRFLKGAWIPGVPAWVLPGILVFAVITVWLRLHVVDVTYSVNEVEKNIHQLQKLKDQLDLKASSLRSPVRLERLAREQFGLAPPRAGQRIQLKQSPSGSSSEADHEP